MQPELKSNKLKFVVVDDQELALYATVNVLKQHYPEVDIFPAANSHEALLLVANNNPDLAVVDLCIPENKQDSSQTNTGIKLLKQLMQKYPTLNIVVQSAYPRSLIRLKPVISLHQGGFTVADKSLAMSEMLTKVDWALKGVFNTPAVIRSGLEVKPEWLEMLQLASNKELTDKAIADQMNVAEGTVRHYWKRIQDALGVYPDAGKNLRIHTINLAKEKGLID
ncbi:MAG: response regulator transcription factor [Rivularia sp. (in: Bacteria)]|nr:response regulator transcription factor [Rivularia sp. MS3]